MNALTESSRFSDSSRDSAAGWSRPEAARRMYVIIGQARSGSGGFRLQLETSLVVRIDSDRTNNKNSSAGDQRKYDEYLGIRQNQLELAE